MRVLQAVIVTSTLFLAPPLAWAQTRTSVTGLGAAGTGSSVAGRSQGLQQTGQLSSEAAIQRDPNQQIGSNTGSFLSRSATAGGGGGGTSNLLGGISQLGIASGGFGRGLGGLGGFGGFGGGVGGGQFNTGFGNATGSTAQLRIPVRIGFQSTPVAATAVSSRFAQRLTKLPSLDLKNPVAVRMDGRTAVLQGAVASEEQRDLIARLALLEPGISDVQNELTVDPSLAAQPDSLPAN